MTGATARLSAWASALSFDDIPDDVIDTVLRHTLDAIGSMVVGSTQPWTGQVRTYVDAESPDGRCCVPFLERTVRPEWAALAGATAAHGFEIDDYALPGLSHPGSVVVPTALALAQQSETAGTDLIAALAAGFETTVRFGEACTPSLTSDRGFHVTSALGVFGSVAVATNLSALDDARAAAAFGIAAAHAGGTTEFTRTGGDIKRLHAGMAAAAGIRSASLASAGITGPTAAIEGERGFIRAFVEKARPDALTDSLGDRWALRGLALKRWCVCAGLQAPLAALDSLLTEHSIIATDITEVIVGFDRATLAHVGHIGGSPRDMTEAQMSVHHAMALRIAAGGNDPEHYRLYQDGLDVSAIADRVRLVVDDESERLFPARLVAEVTVATPSGRFRSRAEAPGSPEAPLSMEATIAKFRTLCDPIIGSVASVSVVAAVRDLPAGGRATAILDPIRKATSAP